jgi:hypothetical protein
MSWAINQDCRDSRGNILSDIINITKQHIENGPPPVELGVDGNIYTDALTGQQYQKQGGQWVLTVDLPAVSGGGGQTLASGDGVNVLIDNPVPGTTTFTMGQSVSHLGNGIRVYDPLISGAGAVEARTIKNSDGALSVSQAMDGAVSIDNNNLLSGLNNVGNGYQVATGNGGDLRTISSTSANFNIDYSVPDEKILMTVQDVLFLQQINKTGAVAQLNVEGSFFNNGNINTSSVNNSQSITNNRQLVANNGILQWQGYTKSIQETVKDVNDGTGIVWAGNDESNPAEGTAYVLYSAEGLIRLQQITAKIVDATNYQISSGTMNLQIGYIPQGSATNDANFNLIWEAGFATGQVNPQISFDFSQLAAPLPSIPNLSSIAFRINKTNVVLSSGDDKAEATVHLIYN